MTCCDDPVPDSVRSGVVPRSDEIVHGASGPLLPTAWDITRLAVVVAILRFAYVADRTVVSLTPDEFASLGVGRFLAGGQFNMLVAGTYRAMPGILLTPWSWLFDDPAMVVRLGLATNALIAGATMFVLVPLVGRLTSFGRTGTLLTSGLIAVLPQSLEASAHLWAEPLVTLTFLGAIGAVLRHLDQPSWSTALVPLAWSTLGAASHGRLIPLAVLVGGVVVVHALVARRVGLAALAAGAAASFLGAVTLVHRWIVSNVWEFPGSQNSESTILRRLEKPIEVLDAAAGQTWYQLSASGLLVAFGIVELVRRAFWHGPGRIRSDARVVLGLTMPLVGVSFVFMSDVGRADHVLYGRYSDAVIWPVLAVGAHWLYCGRPIMSVRRRRFVIGGTIVVFVELALLVHQLHRHQIRVPGVNAMIAGIVPMSDGGSINALVVTGVAMGVAGLMFLAVRSHAADRPIWTLVLVAVVLTAGFRLWVIQRPDANRLDYRDEVRAILTIPERPPLGSSIGVALMPNEYGPAMARISQLQSAFYVQLNLPEYRFVFDNGPSDNVGPYVYAVENDALLTRKGGTIIWEHPALPMALWLEPPRDDDPSGSND